MSIYTFYGPRRKEDWAIDKINIGRNPDGSLIQLARGDSADLTSDQYRYLNQRFVLIPGVGGGADPLVNPTQGPKGDAGVGAINTSPSTFAIPAGAWNTVATGGPAGGMKNTVGKTILLNCRVGVISGPKENGHVYLEICPDNNGGSLPTTGWITMDYIACRNNQAAADFSTAPVSDAGNDQATEPTIGTGKGLMAFVQNGWWYRLRTQVVVNYDPPQFVMDGATPGSFQSVG